MAKLADAHVALAVLGVGLLGTLIPFFLAVGAVRVLSPLEVVAHPHLAERHGFPSIDHPTRRAVRVTATPFHVDGRPLAPPGAAPYRVGEHTRDVLTEVLGYSPERIEELRKLGAVETV